MRPSIPVLLLLLASGACAAAPGRVATTLQPAAAAPPLGVDARYLPALDAVRSALDSGENELARRVLAQLAARIDLDAAREDAAIAEHAEHARSGPPPARASTRAREIVRAYERILSGRERVAALRLALVLEDASPAGTLRLRLRAASDWPAPLVLDPGPATLRVHQVALTPEGRELRSVWSRPLDAPADLELRPGRERLLELGVFEVDLPRGAIALRTRWELQLRSGELREEREGFPAMRVRVSGAERALLAPFLPSDPVEPAELERFVRESGLASAPLLERTVRIPEERHGEALDLLAPIVAGYTDRELLRIAPALRWLTRGTAQPADLEGWRRWMRARARGR